jgi:hypothetical protein
MLGQFRLTALIISLQFTLHRRVKRLWSTVDEKFENQTDGDATSFAATFTNYISSKKGKRTVWGTAEAYFLKPNNETF